MRCGLLILMMLLTPVVQALEIDALLPPGVGTGGINGQMQFNGLPLGLHQFESEQSPQQILLWYRKQWQGRADETEIEQWRQISTFFPPVFVTAQLRSNGDGGTLGRLIISDFSKQQDPKPSLLPAGARLMTDLVSNQGPTQGRLTVLRTRDSVSETLGWYVHALNRDGFSKVSDAENAQSGSRVVRFVRGDKTAQLVILPLDSGSEVMLTQTDGVEL